MTGVQTCALPIYSVMVKLAQMGTVLVTGDLAHFRENYDGFGVPSFNTGRPLA